MSDSFSQATLLLSPLLVEFSVDQDVCTLHGKCLRTEALRAERDAGYLTTASYDGHATRRAALALRV